MSPLENKQAIIPTKHIKGTDSTLSIFGIEICKSADSYANFCEVMKIKEKKFVESLIYTNMITYNGSTDFIP